MVPIIARSTKLDFPLNWEVLDAMTWSFYTTYVPFKLDLRMARRFGARYRFAKCIKELVLDGYASADTCSGYTALTQLAFAYSACESMFDLIGVPRKATHPVLKAFPVHKWVADLRAIDPTMTLFRFVLYRLAPKHERSHVSQFLRGHDCDVTALAAAFRHTFLHGALTPNANKVDPTITVRTCDYLRQTLFEIMDQEIGSRLAPFTSLVTKPSVPPAWP